MKKISSLVRAALLLSVVIDLMGFAFGLFYEGVFYDNLAHFLTTFSLVALAAELYLRHGMNDYRSRPHIRVRRALVFGAAAALLGAAAWEGFESLLNLTFPETIYNPPLDSFVDTAFGVAGGMAGGWRTVVYFDLIPPGTNPEKPSR